MKIRYGIAATILLTFTNGSINAAGPDWSFERYLLDKEGGVIEVQATHPDDKHTRDAVRQQLHDEARNGVSFATPAMQRQEKQIQYRYENTARGGRIRITARNREALVAVQDFLRSRMSKSPKSTAVGFDYVANSSLIVVPVMINNYGPYKFLLDTGATKSVLSTKVADNLSIPKGRIEMLFSAGGNLPVTARTLKILEVGATRLENVEIAAGNLPLMKTLQVDGLLGSDYLRRFKVLIDYDNGIVDLQPYCDETISLLVT